MKLIFFWIFILTYVHNTARKITKFQRNGPWQCSWSLRRPIWIRLRERRPAFAQQRRRHPKVAKAASFSRVNYIFLNKWQIYSLTSIWFPSQMSASLDWAMRLLLQSSCFNSGKNSSLCRGRGGHYNTKSDHIQSRRHTTEVYKPKNTLLC